VSKKVGNGTSTFFWYDRWLGDVPLCTRFRRLFDITSNKLSTVANMVALGGDVDGEAWGLETKVEGVGGGDSRGV